MRDLVITAGLSLGLAALVTAYLSTAYGLLWRPPRWRAAVALLVPVLCPFWAWREKMHVRAVLFVLAAVGYGVAYWSAWRPA